MKLRMLIRLLCLFVVAGILAGCNSFTSFQADSGSRGISEDLYRSENRSGSSASVAYGSQPTNNAAPQSTFVQYGDIASVPVEGIPKDAQLEGKSVSLNFVDTDVREFARVLFSELLERPYVVQPDVSGAVTLRSGGNIDGNTALALARQALNTTGNTIIVRDGIYQLVRQSGGGLDPSANMRTYSLKYVDGQAAEGLLAPMLAGRAEIVGVAVNSITLRGDNETLSLAESLLGLVDVDKLKSSSFALLPLNNSGAGNVADELDALYQNAGVNGVRILPIDRMNAILVIAQRRQHIEFAQEWVQRLDQGRSSDRKINVYAVKNRDAADLAPLLAEIFAARSDGNGQLGSVPEGTPLTDAGAFLGPQLSGDRIKITADPTTNSLVVWASADEMELVKRALVQLDTPISQVYVEATIAEVRLNGELSHGVRWFLQSGNFSFGITDTNNGTVGPSFPGFNFSFQVPEAKLVISALESYTDVRVVSSPQLTVVDRQTATIQVGDQVPITTKTIQDASGGATVIANDITFRDTGVILRVTPQIRGSGEVLLAIEQEVSRVVPTTSSQINSPTFSQRKVQSTVLVPDGTAIVLGGLINGSDEQGSGGLPGTQKTLLESIFGSGKTASARTELIVIIRPVIINDKGDLRDVVNEIAGKMRQVTAIRY